MVDLNGNCMCGAVRWSYSGAVTRSLVCHCSDCQRATSSPLTAFIGLDLDRLIWSGAPNHYQSSPGTWRGFCPTCGTRLYFRSERWPREIHIHAATLEDPRQYKPDRHVFHQTSPDWVCLSDDLPKHEGFHMSPGEIKAKGEQDWRK